MKKIAACVLTIHMFLVLSLTFFKAKEVKPEIKKLTVKQYVAKKIEEPKKVAPPISRKPPAPKKVAQAAPTPPQKIVKSVKKEPVPGPPPKTSAPVSSPLTQKLIKELEESIAKIEGSHDKVDTAKQNLTPRPIETLPINIPVGKESVPENYTRTLITALKGSLHLPDFGEVTIELTLKQDGSVAKLVILKTESANNRRYLETHLPHVKFPALNKPEHIFVLTFCNEV